MDALYNSYDCEDGYEYEAQPQGNDFNEDENEYGQDWADESDDRASVNETLTVSDPDVDIFSKYAQKFRKADSVAPEVSDNLASLVNSTFREGMSDDHFNDVSKQIVRPSNCEALKETRVNS